MFQNDICICFYSTTLSISKCMYSWCTKRIRVNVSNDSTAVLVVFVVVVVVVDHRIEPFVCAHIYTHFLSHLAMPFAWFILKCWIINNRIIMKIIIIFLLLFISYQIGCLYNVHLYRMNNDAVFFEMEISNCIKFDFPFLLHVCCIN